MSRIRTYLDVGGQTHKAGDAYFTLRRGRLSATFSYEPDYLGRREAYAIDPVLGLTSGSWPLPSGLPGAFSDAAPDRWGRNLIAKRLRARAAEERRPVPTLDDRDYLLGVSDETRQGALRSSLMHAADAVARDAPGHLEAIKTLLDAGTGSLGGARPKASVRDDDRLMIAKFAHHADEWNVIAWEKSALDLAENAGIIVPRRQLVGVEGSCVLLLDRFDRDGDRRIGYVSAMTLLEAQDGQSRDYTELAEVIPDYGSATARDLRELWRRIAFSVAVHNTDDHLRNHGFLRRDGGWTLAPAFDVNPNPDPAAQRVTGIGGASSPVDEVNALLIYSDKFGLTDAQARSVLREVAEGGR